MVKAISPPVVEVENYPKFRWNERRELAAQLVVADDLTNEQIAERVGVSKRAIVSWKGHPVFQARVQEILADMAQRIYQTGLANRERRIMAMNHRWKLLHQVISERGTDPSMQGVPGGSTGLLVRTYKTVGPKGSEWVEEEYSVDAALLKEIRELEKQAAQEAGQWLERAEVSGSDEFMEALREFANAAQGQ